MRLEESNEIIYFLILFDQEQFCAVDDYQLQFSTFPIGGSGSYRKLNFLPSQEVKLNRGGDNHFTASRILPVAN